MLPYTFLQIGRLKTRIPPGFHTNSIPAVNRFCESTAIKIVSTSAIPRNVLLSQSLRKEAPPLLSTIEALLALQSVATAAKFLPFYFPKEIKCIKQKHETMLHFEMLIFYCNRPTFCSAVL